MKKIYILLPMACLLMSAMPLQADTFYRRIKITTWNIGHFALGNSNKSTIAAADFDKMKKEYTDFIESLDCDFLAVEEYSPVFAYAGRSDAEQAARNAILSKYETAIIGPVYSYNCNALFLNGFDVLKTTYVDFTKMVQHRYLQESQILMDGDTIKLVVTHLDWNQGDNGAAYRTLQIKELIQRYKDDKFVILCADWNVSNGVTEYDAFTAAGYYMVNHGASGNLKTYPAENPKSCLDNIIVKGLSIASANTKVHARADLSDHCALSSLLLKKSVTGIRSAVSAPAVTVKGGMIEVSGFQGQTEVYDLTGKLVYMGPNRRISVSKRGIYLVKAGGRTVKVRI